MLLDAREQTELSVLDPSGKGLCMSVCRAGKNGTGTFA